MTLMLLLNISSAGCSCRCCCCSHSNSGGGWHGPRCGGHCWFWARTGTVWTSCWSSAESAADSSSADGACGARGCHVSGGPGRCGLRGDFLRGVLRGVTGSTLQQPHPFIQQGFPVSAGSTEVVTSVPLGMQKEQNDQRYTEKLVSWYQLSKIQNLRYNPNLIRPWNLLTVRWEHEPWEWAKSKPVTPTLTHSSNFSASVRISGQFETKMLSGI